MLIESEFDGMSGPSKRAGKLRCGHCGAHRHIRSEVGRIIARSVLFIYDPK
jgi:hypothetical protein